MLLFQRLHGSPEGVHVLLSGGPAGTEAHTGVGGIGALPVLIAEVLPQNGQLLIRHNGVLLVGGGVKQQGISGGDEDIPDLIGHLIGMAGNSEIQIVSEQGVELDAQQTALGHAAAPLLHDEAEVLLQSRVHDDHGLTEQSTDLGAADIEHVAQVGDLRQGQVSTVGHDAVAQPGAVDEQGQAVPAAHVVQLRQLRLGVKGASLGGIGDVDHAGLDDMLRGLVVSVPLYILLHLRGRDLAVSGGQISKYASNPSVSLINSIAL